MGNSCGCCSKQKYEHKEAETPTQAELIPIEFNSVANTLKTGDVCVLHGEGTEHIHYAMFVVYEDLGDHSPLLLLKGKTKPLPLELFKREREKSLRHVRIVSANGRLFYSDYVKILIYRLKQEHVIKECVDYVSEIVRKLNYHEDELRFIEGAKISDARRSQYVCTFMLAHVMSRLGCMSCQPHTITPENFISHLNLHDEPISIKLPETTKGPCFTGSPPFFVKLM